MTTAAYLRPLRINNTLVRREMYTSTHIAVAYAVECAMGLTLDFVTNIAHDYYAIMEASLSLDMVLASVSDFGVVMLAPISLGYVTPVQSDLSGTMEVPLKLDMTAKGKMPGWQAESGVVPDVWKPEDKPKLF